MYGLFSLTVSSGGRRQQYTVSIWLWYYHRTTTGMQNAKHKLDSTFMARAMRAPSVGRPIRVLFLITASLHTQPACENWNKMQRVTVAMYFNRTTTHVLFSTLTSTILLMEVLEKPCTISPSIMTSPALLYPTPVTCEKAKSGQDWTDSSRHKATDLILGNILWGKVLYDVWLKWRGLKRYQKQSCLRDEMLFDNKLTFCFFGTTCIIKINGSLLISCWLYNAQKCTDLKRPKTDDLNTTTGWF